MRTFAVRVLLFLGLLACTAGGATADGEACGGLAGVECPAANEFCKLAEGRCCCDFEGVCTPFPAACPAVVDPVCGCDGVTYTNECEADRAGVSVDHRGPCGQPCGGAISQPCPDGQYCLQQHGSCDFADPGVCVPVPDACPAIYDPVCGCDGVTYGNDCEAARAGARILHPGPCDGVCGGIAGIPCPEGEFCLLPLGECCCDVQGMCVPEPDVCPAIFDPVCGCDGRTYQNRCEAIRAGVSIEHPGPCPLRPCSNTAADQCLEGEFCLTFPGECGGDGFCVPIPPDCDPACGAVCGCDGVSYRNQCEAAQARTSTAHFGVCGEVQDVRFRANDHLSWSAADNAAAYNVYRVGGPAVTHEEGLVCFEAGVTETRIEIPGSPGPQRSWGFAVTGIYGDGEGPVGLTSQCVPRPIVVPCDVP